MTGRHEKPACKFVLRILRKHKLGTFFVGKPAQPSHDLTEHKKGPLNIMLPLFSQKRLNKKRLGLRNLISVGLARFNKISSVSLRSRALREWTSYETYW